MDQTQIFAAIIAAMTTSLIVMVRYWTISGFFAWLTNARRPDLLVGLKRQMRSERLWSISGSIIYGLPAGLALWAWSTLGKTRIYSDANTMPLWWLPLSIVVYLFIHDTWFYWTHRAMHLPSLYRTMHYVHHQSHPPTAWAAMSFHPWESLSGAFLFPVLVFIIPIHWGALAMVGLVMSLFGVTNHLGWEIFPRWLVHGRFGKMLITASHHNLHHNRNKCNYGLYFRFWDWLCGTDRGLHDFSTV